MKLSKYNYYYQKGAHWAILNTYTGSFILLPSKEYNQLVSLSNLSDAQIEVFYDLGILIDDDCDEFAIMQFDNNYYAVNSPFHFRILTTTACNAKCTYCYEHDVPVSLMDEATARKTVAFIKHTVPQGSNIHIEWFGGEPLVNADVIFNICNNLRNLEYSFESTMVTNGILLNPQMIMKLKDYCNLKKVQITLDGLPEVYSAIKNVPQADFYKTINNIKNLANNDITVHIRMNYKDNDDALLDLIYYLGKHIGFHARIFYYIYPLFQKQKYIPLSIVEKILNLNDALLNTGLMKKSDLYRFSYRQIRCFAVGYNSYTIAPNGNLYNCTHIMNEKGLVGTVDKYSPYSSNRIHFINQNISAQCADCILFPLCKGGCRAAELDEAELNQCIIYKSAINSVLDKLIDIYNFKEE